jgi:o-succinylbenzoate synthase
MPITVTEVTLSIVRLNLVREFETSTHRKDHLDHIVVRLTANDGIKSMVGWGECASPSDPFYCGETTETCWQMLNGYLAPMLLGQAWQSPADAARLTAAVSGNNFARAGLDIACWDLFAQSQGVPLASALGPHTAGHVVAGVSLGIEASTDVLLEQVAHHVNQGYRRVKLKIRPGWDLEPVREVRAAFPSVALQVDANAAYAAADSALLSKLDDSELLMVEQPFAADDLLLHAELAARMHTPVCLDESITSLAVLRTALALEACSVVNIKVSRLGGIGAAKTVHDACLDAGVPVWCGGMHEFGIGRAANLAVASLPGFTLPSDLSGSDKYFHADVVTPPIRANDGLVPVPHDRSGIGVTVDEAAIADHTLRTRTIRAPRQTPQPKDGDTHEGADLR